MRALRIMKKQRVILENFWAFFERNTHIEWEKRLKKEGCGKLNRLNGDNHPINPLYTQTDVISLPLRKKFPAFPQSWSKIAKIHLSPEGQNLEIIQFLKQAGFNVLWLESTTSASYPQSIEFLKEQASYHHGLVIELHQFLNLNETINNAFDSVLVLPADVTLSPYSTLQNTTQVISTVEQLIHRHKKTTTGFFLSLREAALSKSHSNATTLASLLYEAYTYIDLFTEKKIKIDELLPHLRFIIAPCEDYFLSISKHIALRMLWEDFCRCYTDLACPALIYTEGSVRETPSTEDEQHFQLLRLTLQAMSSIQGGSNGMVLPPTGLLKGNADQRLSVNLGHLLETESLLTQYRNAAEGTYYIECLTHSLYTEAKEELFNRIER